LAKRLKRGDDTVTYEGKGSPLPSGSPARNFSGYEIVWKAAGFKVIDGTAIDEIISEFSELPKQKQLAEDLGLDQEDQETLYAEFISEYKEILEGQRSVEDVADFMEDDVYRLFRYMVDKGILDADSDVKLFKAKLKKSKK